MHVQQYLDQEWEKRRNIEKTSPHTDLSSEYIKNLKVLANKNELLGSLTKNANVIIAGGSWDFIDQVILLTQPKMVKIIYVENSSDMEVLQTQFRKEIHDRQVELVSGTQDFEVNGLPDAWADWIYISADYLVFNISKFLESCQLKVKKNGMIVGENYAVGNWITSQRFEVIEAVNTFCKVHGWEMVYLTNESNRQLHFAVRRFAGNGSY